MRSVPMVVAGVSSMVVGTGAIATGAGLAWMLASAPILCIDSSRGGFDGGCSRRSDSGLQALSGVLVGAGALALLGSVPMIFFGTSRVPRDERAAVWLTPFGAAGRF